MKDNRKKAKERKRKKAWEKPDFEIHSLLDKNLYLRGVVCDTCFDCNCTCDPGS